MKQPDKTEQMVQALLCCPSAEDAARQCGVSRTTLWRHAREADFKQRLQEARANLSREIVFSLQANALDAVNTLRTVMRDEQSPVSTRVAAAGKLLDLSLRAKEQLETDERIAAVEAALKLR